MEEEEEKEEEEEEVVMGFLQVWDFVFWSEWQIRPDAGPQNCTVLWLHLLWGQSMVCFSC